VVYLQDVQAPVFRGVTNADLAEHVLELRKALERSNLDKAAIRQWYSEGEE
jgi:DNA-binding winged helix-turn-helix (wHTH) protein